jgi:hypothetical protein
MGNVNCRKSWNSCWNVYGANKRADGTSRLECLSESAAVRLFRWLSCWLQGVGCEFCPNVELFVSFEEVVTLV